MNKYLVLLVIILTLSSLALYYWGKAHRQENEVLNNVVEAQKLAAEEDFQRQLDFEKAQQEKQIELNKLKKQVNGYKYDLQQAKKDKVFNDWHNANLPTSINGLLKVNTDSDRKKDSSTDAPD